MIDLPILNRGFRKVGDSHLVTFMRAGLAMLDRGVQHGALFADCAAAELAARKLERDDNQDLANMLRVKATDVAWQSGRNPQLDLFFRQFVGEELAAVSADAQTQDA